MEIVWAENFLEKICNPSQARTKSSEPYETRISIYIYLPYKKRGQVDPIHQQHIYGWMRFKNSLDGDSPMTK